MHQSVFLKNECFKENWIWVNWLIISTGLPFSKLGIYMVSSEILEDEVVGVEAAKLYKGKDVGAIIAEKWFEVERSLGF